MLLSGDGIPVAHGHLFRVRAPVLKEGLGNLLPGVLRKIGLFWVLCRPSGKKPAQDPADKTGRGNVSSLRKSRTPFQRPVQGRKGDGRTAPPSGQSGSPVRYRARPSARTPGYRFPSAGGRAPPPPGWRPGRTPPPPGRTPVCISAQQVVEGDAPDIADGSLGHLGGSPPGDVQDTAYFTASSKGTAGTVTAPSRCTA